MEDKTILVLALLFTLGVLLQLMGCILYSNWWPMLTAFFYVLIPMPYLFFSGASGEQVFYSSEMEIGWMEAGKFLTGCSAVGLLAVPIILMHAQYITIGAMMIEIAAAATFGAMVCVYDYASQDSFF